VLRFHVNGVQSSYATFACFLYLFFTHSLQGQHLLAKRHARGAAAGFLQGLPRFLQAASIPCKGCTCFMSCLEGVLQLFSCKACRELISKDAKVLLITVETLCY
jgi:hypothetical protein